jgi:methionyl-tRNA synthetase
MRDLTTFAPSSLQCLVARPLVLRHACSFTSRPVFSRVAHSNAVVLDRCRLLRIQASAASRNDKNTVDTSEDIRGRTLQITTPLFYVNAPPHMGSAYPTIAADTLARFYRLAGARPLFVTGCDEHGEKIALAAAAAAGMPAGEHLPNAEIQKFCDKTATDFRDLWNALDIKFDRFVRTTSATHASVVREFIERVWKNGDIYKDIYQGLYCTGCEEYKDPKDLIDNTKCPAHLKPCEHRKEENYFFALSKYQEKLEQFHHDYPEFVQPRERRNEVLGWIKDGLRDFSVSRANNPWGIPVPRDESQTIYVWFDALLGYVSALLAPGDQPTLEAALSHGWPADVHIIGKDILRFHAVYWPAMLLSAGLPLPRRVVGHGFVTKDGLKMGKSLGNTLDPRRLVQVFGSDAVRYYFMRGVDFGRDGDFSDSRFINLVNADLANSFGNLLNRSLNLLWKNCDGVLAVSSAEIGDVNLESNFFFGEKDLKSTATFAAADAYQRYMVLDFVGACEALLTITTAANAYIDRAAPWKGFKSNDPGQVSSAARCIVGMLEAVRIVAVGLSPVTPRLSERTYAALGLESEYKLLEWESAMVWGRLVRGMVMAKASPVFPRIEAVAVEENVAVRSS